MKISRPHARDNPFRTDKLEALLFTNPGFSVEALFNRLRDRNFTGSIVGPEGTGKTTLLLELYQLCCKSKFSASFFTIGEETSSRDFLASLTKSSREKILFIDRAELLSWPLWLRILHQRRGFRNLVITSHSSIRLPVIYRCRPSFTVFLQLTEHLCPETFSEIELRKVYRAHRGNMRTAFLDLYDRVH